PAAQAARHLPSAAVHRVFPRDQRRTRRPLRGVVPHASTGADYRDGRHGKRHRPRSRGAVAVAAERACAGGRREAMSAVTRLRSMRYDAERTRTRRPLATEAVLVQPVRADDGVMLRLTRYRGGRKGPVILSHCIGVSSRMYSIDTIEPNL